MPARIHLNPVSPGEETLPPAASPELHRERAPANPGRRLRWPLIAPENDLPSAALSVSKIAKRETAALPTKSWHDATYGTSSSSNLRMILDGPPSGQLLAPESRAALKIAVTWVTAQCGVPTWSSDPQPRRETDRELTQAPHLEPRFGLRSHPLIGSNGQSIPPHNGVSRCPDPPPIWRRQPQWRLEVPSQTGHSLGHESANRHVQEKGSGLDSNRS